MSNLINVILKTIEDVQQKNKKNPNEKTADPSVFDILREKVQKIDQKAQANQVQKGRRAPKSILDMIKDGIEGARKENRVDKKVETAPGSIFDQLLKKVNQPQQRQASTGVRKIVEDYKLDVSRVPADVMSNIQQQYQGDVKKVNQQYAQAIYDMVRKMK